MGQAAVPHARNQHIWPQMEAVFAIILFHTLHLTDVFNFAEMGSYTYQVCNFALYVQTLFLIAILAPLNINAISAKRDFTLIRVYA